MSSQLISWVKVTSTIDHADFITHANYLDFLKRTSENIKLVIHSDINKRIKEDKKLSQKVFLINLTVDNLREEFKNTSKYQEYAVVCVSWIPVKSYYVIFNLLIILEYLITGHSSYLSITHNGALNFLKKLISDGSLKFEPQEFNNVHSVREIEGWKIPRYENIKKINADPRIRYKQVIKKLSGYQKEEYKRRNKINRLVGKELQKFKKASSTNLCEFFYWYRIKANYRDMEFIDKGVPAREFKEFYENYFYLTLNFYKALKIGINNIAKIRFGKEIIS